MSMDIHAEPGTRVRYVGATDDPVLWGTCDDPRKVLCVGHVYTVHATEVHSWHTKVRLAEELGSFPSACFEEVEPEPEPASKPSPGAVAAAPCAVRSIPAPRPRFVQAAVAIAATPTALLETVVAVDNFGHVWRYNVHGSKRDWEPMLPHPETDA